MAPDSIAAAAVAAMVRSGCPSPILSFRAVQHNVILDVRHLRDRGAGDDARTAKCRDPVFPGVKLSAFRMLSI